MLRNILTTGRAGAGRPGTSTKVLAEGLEREADRRARRLPAWILHAGGREILAAIRQRVGLTEEQTRLERAVLRDYGNVSSPCVYFVLEAALNEGRARRLLVDVVVRSRLQLPRSPACGRVTAGRKPPRPCDDSSSRKFSITLPRTIPGLSRRGAIFARSTHSWVTPGWSRAPCAPSGRCPAALSSSAPATVRFS